MATIYRDYGGLNGRTNTNSVQSITHRQVYQATHEGEDRLPFMKRSFISFSFGGKPIEDFDLIATFSNDRLDKSGYAGFEDIVSNYEVLDGQLYWRSHYTANTLDFTLSTDGMDQKALDDFLYWFLAGKTKELILAEHPNRAILARVSSPPQLSLLPFEHPIEMKIGTAYYLTSTTLYKGNINISFVMDSPHWYALMNILGVLNTQTHMYDDTWKNEKGEYVNIFASKDALKILYEDGIPLGSIIQDNMLLGNGSFANVEAEENLLSKTWSLAENLIEWTDGIPTGVGARIHGTLTSDERTSLISQGKDIKWPAGDYVGYITGSFIDASGNGIETLPRATNPSSNYNNNAFFYYSGTAPAPVELSFTLTPNMNGNKYITVPYNSIVGSNPKYNTITIESENKLEFNFTTPNLFTSYNKVIQIFTNYLSSKTVLELRKMMIEEIKHVHVREWAIKILDTAIINSNTNKVLETISNMKLKMSYMITDSDNIVLPASFVFNSETGEATGTFKYRTIDGSSTISDWSTYCTDGESFTTHTEDVGDMLRSNYLIIRDRNYPNKDGEIVHWKFNDKLLSHRIYHNLSVPLKNLQIIYKNMYL